MKLWSLAALVLMMGGNAWADEGEHSGRPHTHWWLGSPTLEWYAGGAFGQSTFSDWEIFNDGSFTSVSSDDSDTGWRLFVGADFGRYLSVELGYSDFGEATLAAQSDGSGSFWGAGPVDQTVELEGIDLTFVGKVPLTDAWILFAKGSVFSSNSSHELTGTNQSNNPVAFSGSGDDFAPSYGAGVRYDGFLPLRIVAEYWTAPFEVDLLEDGQVDSIGVSLAYLF